MFQRSFITFLTAATSYSSSKKNKNNKSTDRVVVRFSSRSTSSVMQEWQLKCLRAARDGDEALAIHVFTSRPSDRRAPPTPSDVIRVLSRLSIVRSNYSHANAVLSEAMRSKLSPNEISAVLDAAVRSCRSQKDAVVLRRSIPPSFWAYCQELFLKRKFGVDVLEDGITHNEEGAVRKEVAGGSRDANTNANDDSEGSSVWVREEDPLTNRMYERNRNTNQIRRCAV
eukprot:PhM_4_TR2545/c0_g1_i1/m.10305